MAARLIRLQPGENIDLHTDSFFGFEYGKLRIHAPVITSEASLMLFDNDSVHWSAGQLWYGDFGKPHSVINNSSQSRYHIVVDCLINPLLLDSFPESHYPKFVMLNRTVTSDQLPSAIGVGHWSVRVSEKALDWTLDRDSDKELQISFWVDNTTYEAFLTLPSGIIAKLRHLGGNDYRLGFMPEETIVRILEDTIEIIRRVNDKVETYACSLQKHL